MTSLKGTVAQAVPNDATTDTANDTTQEVDTLLATMTVETPKEAVEVREVLEREYMAGPTEEELIVSTLFFYKNPVYKNAKA